jgi:hypothetical protein
MRKILAGLLVSSLILAVVPSAALAGDPHAVRNRWTGVAIGAGSVILGGLLLNALLSPAPAPAAPTTYVAPPPPVVYHVPPPVIYEPPPVVVYSTPPRVIYAPAPVVVHRTWGPPGHWKTWHRKGGHWKHGWDRD